MLENEVVVYALEFIMRFKREFDDQVSGMHSHSLMTLTWEHHFVARKHAWLNMNVFLDHNHLLPKTIFHNCQFFKANVLLTSVEKFFKGALNSDFEICETLLMLLHFGQLFFGLDSSNDLAVLVESHSVRILSAKKFLKNLKGIALELVASLEDVLLVGHACLHELLAVLIVGFF